MLTALVVQWRLASPLWAQVPSESVFGLGGAPAVPVARPALGTRVVDPGSLRDLWGNIRGLDELRGDAPVTVLVFLGIDCPLANLYVPRLNELSNSRSPRGVRFFAVYPHENESIEQVAAHALEREVVTPVLKDQGQALADALGITRTPEACLIDAAGVLRYRGRIDDQFGHSRRAAPGRADLAVAIDELLAGREVSIAETAGDGCVLDRRSSLPRPARVTYSGEVAEVLERKCQSCHRAGGSAPMTLASYEDAVRWAAMIGTVVRDGRMPPWHADRRFGHFNNDRSLSPTETGVLLAWAESDLARGEERARPVPPAVATGWGIGTPDVVVECPESFEIPASGPSVLRFAAVPEEVSDRVFSEGRWLQAAELLPEFRDVTHHLVVNLIRPGAPIRTDWLEMTELVGMVPWTPGDPVLSFPPGTAMWIPAGTRIQFGPHYNPSGVPRRDRPRLALKFASGPPQYEAQIALPLGEPIDIPPGRGHHRQEVHYQFAEPAQILAIMPHMHVRGTRAKLELVVPGRERETLLAVPRFDFNWQTMYWFQEPLAVPAGARLEMTGYWDNSAFNRLNPDPTARVVLGPLTTDEMLVPYIVLQTERTRSSREGRLSRAVDGRRATPTPGNDRVEVRPPRVETAGVPDRVESPQATTWQLVAVPGAKATWSAHAGSVLRVSPPTEGLGAVSARRELGGLRAGERYRLRLTVRADEAVSIRCRLVGEEPSSTNDIGLDQTIDVDVRWQTRELEFLSNSSLNRTRLIVDLSEARAAVELGAAELLPGEPAGVPAPVDSIPAEQRKAALVRSSRPSIGARVRDPGSLRDLWGNVRGLDELRGEAPATVLVFLGMDCPLANLYVPRLNELAGTFGPRGVRFLAVYPHENESIEQVAAHALEREVVPPVLKDQRQELADALGITRTPEACLIDAAGVLRYRGRIDDQFGHTRRAAPERSDLAVALEEVLAGRAVSVAETPADGCVLDRRSSLPRPEQVTYSGEVAGVLERKCQTCHRPGGSAPMTLASYEDAVRWAAMIGTVVRDGRMPPWHADRRYGHFTNDRSLTPEETGVLLAWAESDLARGTAAARPGPNPRTEPWNIGTPDAIVECPESFEIPASGIPELKFALVPEEISDRVFAEDCWLEAAEVLPEFRDVTHHMVVNLIRPGQPIRTDWLEMTELAGMVPWAPGDPLLKFPPGTAMWIPAGTRIQFEVHYNPNGIARRDRPRLALKFAKEPPRHEVRLAVALGSPVEIPPGAGYYRGHVQFRFAEPAEVLGILPHMHLRGTKARHDLVFPDGRRETLLAVPRYDFYWQTLYWLREPLAVPAGTRLEMTGYWDNSSFNRSNPDPTAKVVSGPNGTDEMLVPYIFYQTARQRRSRDEPLFLAVDGRPAGATTETNAGEARAIAENPAVAPTETRTSTPWLVLAEPGATATWSSHAGGVLRIQSPGGGFGPLSARRELAGLRAGQRYRLRLAVRGDEASSIRCRLVGEDRSASGDVGLSQTISVPARWQSPELEFVATSSVNRSWLLVEFAENAAAIELGGAELLALETDGETARSGPAGNSSSADSGGKDSARPSTSPEVEAELNRMIAAEELILGLTPRLKALGRGLANLELPSNEARALFAPQVTANELGPLGERRQGDQLPRLAVEQWHWPVESATHVVSRDALRLWPALVDYADLFDYAKFYLIRGEYGPGDQRVFYTPLGFDARGRRADGGLCHWQGKLSLEWECVGEPADPAAWSIRTWKLEQLTSTEAAGALFADQLGQLVVDPESARQLRRSAYWEEARRQVRSEGREPLPEPPPNHEDRGLATTDLNGDGWDDLAVIDSTGRLVLLENRRGQSLANVTSEYGVADLVGAGSVLFVDLDNDGLPEMLVGSQHWPMRIYIREGSRFVDRTSERVGEPLPSFVSALSAADYNGDGLLDVYLATGAIGGTFPFLREIVGTEQVQEFVKLLAGAFAQNLLPDERAELLRRAEHAKRFGNLVGPPNLLLENVGGGRLRRAAVSSQVAGWHHTLQGSWSDFDGDGDPDLYCANDYGGPANLFRNENFGQAFTDVTAAAGVVDHGWGMGASWGDFDRDGKLDLYVSNMYSKAGRRIGAWADRVLGTQVAQLARGNSLFQNRGDRFEQRAGTDPPWLLVEKVDWSWGSQFGDLDNDGWLDILALNGYYTAPPEVALDVDL